MKPLLAFNKSIMSLKFSLEASMTGVEGALGLGPVKAKRCPSDVVMAQPQAAPCFPDALVNLPCHFQSFPPGTSPPSKELGCCLTSPVASDITRGEFNELTARHRSPGARALALQQVGWKTPRFGAKPIFLSLRSAK